MSMITKDNDLQNNKKERIDEENKKQGMLDEVR